MTARAAQRAGFTVAVVASTHTVAALAEAIHAHLSREIA